MDVSCSTCRWWVEDKDQIGACRRFPPIPIEHNDGAQTVAFPATRADWWCGEFMGIDE